MAIIPVRCPNPNGLSLLWAMESVASPGHWYNFTGGSPGSFTIGPLTTDQLRVLPAETDPAFAGRNGENYDTGSNASAGDYILSFHDADSANAFVTEAGITIPGAGTSLSAAEVWAYSARTLTAAGLDAITVEAGINARQALSPILAACAGVLSGAGSGTITIKGGNTTTTRITATTDSAGDRTVVVLTLPS